MFPLRDTIRPKTYPVVNTIFIVINILIFFYEFSLGRKMEAFVYQFGLTPIRFFWGLQNNLADAVIPVFTSMFLHGGWLHLIGNMWFLYIFGDNVEDRVGHVAYIFFYLLCGIGSALTQTFLQANSNIPMVGASGAIAGVLGAYFMLYPHSRILTLVPIFIFLQIMEIPAVVFLFFWFLWQFIQGALAASTPAQGGVAWWAHIGGFVVGLVLIFFFKKREKPKPSYWN
ncbi:rhomboid family intramembrane serine protease [bacterium]|nr:rhomboid family intramembrane serine protease [bacterium]MCI0601402.1 rhomboid family intramembrane serine protease [bacterium]